MVFVYNQLSKKICLFLKVITYEQMSGMNYFSIFCHEKQDSYPKRPTP